MNLVAWHSLIRHGASGLQGLGKTLQAITLLWTLLRQGLDGQPVAKRVIIVCPTSLVSNWCVARAGRADKRLRPLTPDPQGF
jgi:hypothetical protein